jgi:predicted GNAT family acetyltransferase
MQRIKEGLNKFYIGDEHEPQAEVTFVPTGDKIIILDHTYVSPELEGQGIAAQLVEAVVKYARRTGKKIIPTCSYAVAAFQRNAEYQDVEYNVED